jgi:ABC-type lipoprotein export system ATPase subunit
MSIAAVDVADVFKVHAAPGGRASAALQGLTLSVDDGEIVVVIGPSGSGKTSLLRILAGLDRPSTGKAVSYGLDLARASRRALSRYRAATVGYIDQHYAQALAPELSTLQAVELPLAFRGVAGRERLVRARELLERVGLDDKTAARPAELSGGEQQRVSICAALASAPRLVLADEPTGELDAENAALVYGVLTELARQHRCTLVVVSHDPASTDFADRTVRIRDGRVSEETATGEEVLVVGRGGWVRVPEGLLHEAGIVSRARAAAESGKVVLTPTRRERAAEERPSVVELQRKPASKAGGVSLRDVVMEYGHGRTRTRVLHGLTADFAPGRYHAVTGPSGSGKTTLLNLIAGLELATSGEVEVLGERLSTLSREERASLRLDRVGVVSQQLFLPPFLTVRETVDLALALRGHTRRHERVDQAIHVVDLTDRAEHRVSALSSGEQARLAIARTIASDAPLMLADEPTAPLDQANSLVLAELLRRLAESGVTVICATHDPLLIERAHHELALAPLDAKASTAAADG